ncbi:MAG: isoprenylcysteine carboxylmethyltransferase family protein [Bacteroidales bacterium]|nr:isoprenylcysteine carboxylmethyltransferase family protein [Bacteroidales bacterium]
MTSTYLCIIICAIIWILNGICIVHSLKEQIVSEFYIHTGLGIFLSLLTLELTIGRNEAWKHIDIPWLAVAGWILYVPSAFLVAGSLIALKHKGKPKGADFTATTTFIDSGVYHYVRQPMTLGLAIWSVALILVFQSLPALILGLISLFFFRMAAIKESKYNIRKFGDTYTEYMKRVPMWNIFKYLKQ